MKKVILTALLLPTLAFAEDITIQNLVRAESDTMFRLTMKERNIGIGEIFHEREVASANAPQTVIRPNQDTLYSASVVDLSKPVTVTLPKGDGRFQSVLVISQDHYNFGYSKPGAYKLTEEEVGTRFAMLLFRTFVDAGDPDDERPGARAAGQPAGLGVDEGHFPVLCVSQPLVAREGQRHLLDIQCRGHRAEALGEVLVVEGLGAPEDDAVDHDQGDENAQIHKQAVGEGRHHLLDVGPHAAVGEHRALGRARGPARVLEEGQAVAVERHRRETHGTAFGQDLGKPPVAGQVVCRHHLLHVAQDRVDDEGFAAAVGQRFLTVDAQ